jgi:hypothetical protein
VIGPATSSSTPRTATEVFVWVMVAILGLSAAGVFVNLYEIGWTLKFMAKYPVDIVLTLGAAALGIWAGVTYLG